MNTNKRISLRVFIAALAMVACYFVFFNASDFLSDQNKKENAEVDVLVFSYDRPLQLYACLESIYQNMCHLGHVSVIARASTDEFLQSYEKVKHAFQDVEFFFQGASPKEDFKPLTMRAIFSLPAPYIAFAVDDIVVKDNVDLRECSSALKRFGAWGFYLRLGKNINHCYMQNKDISQPVLSVCANDIHLWSFASAEGDWGYPNSLDMTIFSKKEIRKDLEKLSFHSPNSLESNWARKSKKKKKGLCYSTSKIVNFPLNLVNLSTNRNMQSLEVEELLKYFQAGLKMDIAPFYKMLNHSPHEEIQPTFVQRAQNEIYHKRPLL